MKSNPSPSAPLNLCAPVGVTGTVLPASPEGVACVPALIKGEHYDVSSLSFVGWTDGDGTGHEGYNVADYFRGGIYLGPDDHGIEPIANLPSPAEPVKVPASPVKDTPACPQTYFQSDVVAMVGDRISAGSMGDCKVLELTPDGYLRVQNLFTKETAHVFASDCDLVDRPAPASPVDSVGVPDWKIHSVHSHVIVRTPDVNGGNVHVATFSNEDDAKIAVQAVSSHAAKDAKIKALEEALDGLLDAIHADAVSFPSSPKAVSTARAALTLPCA